MEPQIIDYYGRKSNNHFKHKIHPKSWLAKVAIHNYKVFYKLPYFPNASIVEKSPKGIIGWVNTYKFDTYL